MLNKIIFIAIYKVLNCFTSLLKANEPWAKEHRDKYVKENQLDIRKNAAFKELSVT